MNSKLVLMVLVGLLYRSRCSLAIGAWNYTDQEAWKAVPEWFCTGMRQSPININRNSTVINPDLIDLGLANFGTVAGNWSNSGHNLVFFPETNEPRATFTNHLGTYRYVQFHFHWGSEHTVDGKRFDAEIHFVTVRDDLPNTDGAVRAVVGVPLTAADIPLTGTTWQQFMPIPQNVSAIRVVSGVAYSELLPTDLSYYHYEGSFTSPGCNEIVQWFYLQNSVTIPRMLLDAMRTETFATYGGILSKSYRYTQPLNSRKVMVQGSGCAGLYAFNTVTLLLVALMVSKLTQV